MQTILGSGGAIGKELAKAVSAYTDDIRLVSRNPKKVNSADKLLPADLSVKEQVFKAVEGSEIVYLTVGFDYKTKVWQQLWPQLAEDVTEACLQYNARLVFFDNVYAIGGDNVKHITENSPLSPSSKKGEVRAAVDRLIMDKIEKKNLIAIIARSPDFFSEEKKSSMLMNLVYDNLAKGKKARWLCNAKAIHSCGYAPELARGTAILGNSYSAYGQIWNLPVDTRKITSEQWINLFASEMNTDNKYQTMPGWAIKLLGIFIPVLGEMHEMLYQYDRDYYFDSSKFNNNFNFTPVTNEMAVKQTVSKLKNSKT